MTAIEQAEQLRLQAMNILRIERERIDVLLAQLGDEKGPHKKRGPKPKTIIEPEVLEIGASRS